MVSAMNVEGCRVAQLVKRLATSGYPDGSRFKGPVALDVPFHQLLVATLKVRLVKRRQHSIPPPNLEELKKEKAMQFAAEVTNRFTALEAVENEIIPEDLWKSTKTVLLDASDRKKKKKKWISDETFAVIREKREAKGKEKNRYKELKAEVQRNLRLDKQQQL